MSLYLQLIICVHIYLSLSRFSPMLYGSRLLREVNTNLMYLLLLTFELLGVATSLNLVKGILGTGI